jgi:AcrR family transcriptional regulator
LGAALRLLLEHGYDGLNFAEVAAEAGVSESTVYRRWPTRADLAAAAINELAIEENPLPDTGTLEGDLGQLLEQILDLLRRPEIERVVRAAIALREGEDGRGARVAFFRSRIAGSAEIARRAIERGELPPATDPEEVIEYLVGPAYLRLLVTGGPLDAALRDRSVRRTLAAFGGR